MEGLFGEILGARRVMCSYFTTRCACYYPHLNGGFWSHNKLERDPLFGRQRACYYARFEKRTLAPRSLGFINSSIRVAGAYVEDNAGTSGIIDKVLHSLSLNTNRFLTTILRKYP